MSTVIDDPAAAMAALDPVRANILAILAEPGSSTTVAAALGLPRQQVNYHLRTLERHNLVRMVEERPKRGLTERVMLATARAYVVVAVDPRRERSRSSPDRPALDPIPSSPLPLEWLAKSPIWPDGLTRPANRWPRWRSTVRSDSRRPPTEPRSPPELTAAVTALAAKYHDEHANRGRWHRVVVAAHPIPRATPSSTRRPDHG